MIPVCKLKPHISALPTPSLTISMCYVSAHGMLQMNTGNLDEAIEQFTSVIKVIVSLFRLLLFQILFHNFIM